MKNRLIKTTVIIAVTTLVMLNIQILFDTSDSTFFQGSTAKASDEYYGDEYYQEDSRFLPMRRIELVKCWEFELEVEFIIIPYKGIPVPVPVPTEIRIETNGRRWDCVREKQIIYCDSEKMTECKTSEEEGSGEEVSQ